MKGEVYSSEDGQTEYCVDRCDYCGYREDYDCEDDFEHEDEDEDEDETIFSECSKCGKFAVLPDAWFPICPDCEFKLNLGDK
jgi:hypothetical protein